MSSTAKNIQTSSLIRKGATAVSAGNAAAPSQNALPTGPAPAWQSPGVNALKSALSTARNPNLAPRPKSVMMNVPATPSAVAGQMANLHVSAPQAPDWRSARVYDPSVGPTRSAMTTNWRSSAVGSNATSRTGRQTFQNAVCTLSNLSRSDFHLGDVIAAPFHVANTNPNASPSDPRLVRTVEGFAYSKRRMLVVLFVHAQDMYCLPLYSFGNRGLHAKPDVLKKEYVCMRNAGDKVFANEGPHEPIAVKCRRPLTEATTVHLTGGIRVGCNEDITAVGRLTEEGYGNLLDLWKALVAEAQEDTY